MDEVRDYQENQVEKNAPTCGCGSFPDAGPGETADSLEQDAVLLETINIRLSWMERRRLEQELDAFSLTLPQYMTLRCVLSHPDGCSMTELAESSHQLSATMTGIVDRLVERGLVLRERDARDRRALRVGMTPEGKQLMEKVSEQKRARMVRLLADLPPEDRRALIENSRRYLALLEESLQSTHSPLDPGEH